MRSLCNYLLKPLTSIAAEQLRVAKFCAVAPVRRHIRVGYVKDKIKPATMKLDSPEFKRLFTPELNTLSALFKKSGFELRIAGGAVRDLLMGKLPADVDFATTATPEEMKKLFEQEQIRMLHKRGEEHGTITCRINDTSNFEITTLRIDVVCDGRRAKIEFTKDWQLDANRRDLTINSMFCDLDGTVYDYFNGIADLKKRRVVFVGDAVQRIQEDYLRILRYFRFFGRIATSPDAHEEATLDAITDNAQGLQNVSGERLWIELSKIVVGRFAGPVVKTMLSRCKLAPYLGLPENADVDNFVRIWERCKDLNPEPMTVLPALMADTTDVHRFHKRNKVSNHELRLAEFIVSHRDAAASADDIKFFRDLILDEENGFAGTRQPRGRQRVCELVKYVGRTDLLPELEEWPLPTFPVDGVVLGKADVPKGPQMRRALIHLFKIWKASDYTLTTDELLERVSEADSQELPVSERKRRKLDKEARESV